MDEPTMALAAVNQGNGSVAAPAEEHAGHQFVRCLEENALGETWEVVRPNGNRRLAWVLPASDNAERAVEFLGQINHSALPQIDVFSRQRRPVVVVLPPTQTLRERFRDCWANGMPGLPKKELLGHLEAAADALDDLLRTQRVQHLDVRPESLLVAGDKLYLAGYGLMHHLWLPDRENCSLPNARYAAPELLQPHISSRCDQFSLALIYAEMLTGVHPLRQQRDARRGQWVPPNLGLLASAERAIVGRALAVSPSQRFANCGEFIAALKEADAAASRKSGQFDRVVEIADTGCCTGASSPTSSLDFFVSEMLLAVGAPHFLQQFNSIRYKLEPGRVLEHHCAVRLFPGALLKLEGFRQHWHAHRVYQEDGLVVFRLSLPPTFWQKLTGRRLGLEIQVQVAPSGFGAANRSEVVVLIRPYGCSGKMAVSLLDELGPKILDSLRGYLNAQAEQRHSERMPCNEPLRVLPVLSEVEMAAPIECVSKDISSTGIGFFLSKLPPSSQVYINLPKIPELARFAGLAEIVRMQPCGEGWFEVGARFANFGK